MGDFDLDAFLKATESAREKKDQSLEDLLRRQQADDRSFIAKLVAWSFVLFIGWVVVLTTIGAAMFDWNDIAEPAKYLMTILGSVMLPVVTLVIGHYFGKEK